MKLQLDRWAPQQRKAIETRDTDVLVSAGAGSGKTSVLVERVVSMIAGDRAIDLNRLLIVTFTEAAAAEMRERVAKRIGELRKEAEDKGDTQTAAHLKKQQSLIHQAQISTLHSFCLDIVRRNFFSLGLEPSFSILSEEEGTLLKNDVINNLLEERLEQDHSGRFVHMLRRFRVTQPERLQKLVFRLDEFARSQADPKRWLRRISCHFEQAHSGSFNSIPFAEPFFQWVLRHLDTALQLVRQGIQLAQGQDELQKYCDNLAEAEQLLSGAREEIVQSNGFDTVLPQFTALQGVLKKTVRGKDHPLKERVKELRNRVKKELVEVTEVLARGESALLQDMVEMTGDLAVLLELVEAFQTRTQEQKKQRSQLDFSDLEHLALEAIDNPANGEKQRLQEQFKQIFVDEYQDTSSIQDALVSAVQNGQGNLFVVGDVKQSIYRFRMAEPQLFLDERERLGAGAGAAIDLAANYRSRRQVVDMVNLVFSQLFSPAFGGINYDAETQMQFGALYPESDSQAGLSGPVELHLIERRSRSEGGVESELIAHKSGEQGSVEHSADDSSSQTDETVDDNEDEPVDLTNIEREALVMAERVLDLMGNNDDGQRQVYDTKLQKYRPLRYSDIVILMRSTKGRINTVLDVFTQKGIPAYGATSSGFYGALEIQWLVSAVAAVDNPRREVDFVSLLRSPLAAFSDHDLAQIRLVRTGNFYETVKAAAKSDDVGAELKTRLSSFLSQFRGWRQKARQDKAYDVLKRIVDETNVLYYLLGMPGGPTRRANLEALLDKAREFDKTSYDGIFGFVQRLRDTVKQELDAGEARTLGENEDVVRVMTIHQSKGLEFPVVFVADLGKTFYQGPEDKAFPLHRDYGFGPEFHDAEYGRRWKTLPSIALLEVNQSGFLEEEARVLYVALTRAKEKLILVGSQGNLGKVITNAAQGAAIGGKPLSRSVLMNASTYLDWVLTILFRHPARQRLYPLLDADMVGLLPPPSQTGADVDVKLWNTDAGAALPHLQTPLDDSNEFSDKRIQVPPEAGSIDEFETWLKNLPIGSDERGSFSSERQLRTASWSSFMDVSVQGESHLVDIPGKVTATELRRLWSSQSRQSTSRPATGLGTAENLLDSPMLARTADSVRHDASRRDDNSAPIVVPVSPRESGIAFHAAMQHIDLSVQESLAGVSHALDKLVDDNKLSEAMRAAVSDDDVLSFLSSPLGRRLTAAKRVYREQPFFSRIAVPDPKQGKGSTSFIVVQGVIDCLAEEEDGWLLIDYKTDRVTQSYVETQATEYAAQVATYVQVARQVCRTDDVQPYLYFVKAGAAIKMETVDLSRLFSS
ncbi:UvrD-helicase domain-containing protein [Alicyclobacillus sp. SO9]|uniref:UvrD-helicase domain-containing protein n=1 Tax=Alicyclobacillus sp. SO9 TaxID=2665646 RepID=UPI0018E84F74|nr:UvrD-helicase domain-containing protein [Alicyclobacillus sp. SO9]QQE77422.1 UvrD-helicase domain-containing protein [Alicyclobacillus sp. SO9]